MSKKNEDIEVSYKGSILDDGSMLVTSTESASALDFEAIYAQILSSAMEQYKANNNGRIYSVLEKVDDGSVGVTIDKLKALAVNIRSTLANVLEANKIIMQAVTLDAYMGRAYECIYSNINTECKFEYPELEEGDSQEVFNQVKYEIENFNKFINIKGFVRNAVSIAFLEGNYSTYLRLKKNGNVVEAAIIDHYPLDICYPSDYLIDGEPILQIDISALQSRLAKPYIKSRKSKKALFFDNILPEVKNNYPEEVYKSFSDKEQYAILDSNRTGYVKVNDMGRKFGVSPFFKALEPYIILDNIAKADIADSKARSKKIIFQKLRKELLGPNGQFKGFAEREYAHLEAFKALNTNFCLYTAPAFTESLEYITDDSNKDSSDTTIKNYTSKLLTALGIGFADSSLSSYSTANISVDQLMKTINSIAEQVEAILHKYYQIYLEAIGLPKELAPTVTILDSELMEWGLRKEFANFAFSTLGASRDTVFKLVGLDVADEATKRKSEDEQNLNEVFAPRPTSYNSNVTEITGDGDSEVINTGRPADSDNEAKQEFDKQYTEEVRNT